MKRVEKKYGPVSDEGAECQFEHEQKLQSEKIGVMPQYQEH
jgi:hypothetical protein